MNITMKQARYGAGGALLAAGGTYSVSDEIGAYMVGQGFATDTNSVLRQKNSTQAAMPDVDPLAGGMTISAGGVTVPISTMPAYTPAQGYALAVRASQGGYQNLIDQSPAANVLSSNTGLFPASWAANGAVSLGQYKTPSALNGLIYKCTTAGTNAATEPTWGTTVGGTTVSGTATYTAEKGPYFVDASGIKLFRSIASAQTGVASTFTLPGTTNNQWDMSKGQSLIINLRPKFDYAASGQAAASPVFSNRILTGVNAGMSIVATGSPYNNVRVAVRDRNANSLLTGEFSASFGRKPMDGTERNITVMIDGQLKQMFFFVDGVVVSQSDMFDGANLCPNGFNLAAITGSTVGENWNIGGYSSNATSFECAFKQIDVIVLPGNLPANIQNIASWFARGSEALLPQSLVV